VFNRGQEDIPGLEVLNGNGIWVPAPPIEHAFVVNTGAFFELLSNSKFPSTVHRVHTNVSSSRLVTSSPIILLTISSQLGVERFSFPIFFSPDPSIFIRTHPSLLKENEESKYTPHHIGRRYITGLLHSSPDHPWCRKLKASGIKEENYTWELLTQQFPESVV
jgi:isopenicillin N synthase-like dioxygenase